MVTVTVIHRPVNCLQVYAVNSHDNLPTVYRCRVISRVRVLTTDNVFRDSRYLWLYPVIVLRAFFPERTCRHVSSSSTIRRRYYFGRFAVFHHSPGTMTTSDQLRDVRMVQKYNLEALECNEKLEEKWKQFRKDYENLKTCLEEFPKELSVPIMMPIGSNVYVRAQLCNTNEVFIRYDEIFTKQTAYEARAVCERHIKRCDGMIENLAKEKKLLSDNLCARLDIATESSDDLKEIIEPYDEEKELVWKEVHRQKVKEYKQQLLENKKKQIDEDCKKVMHEFEKAGVNKQLAGTYAKSNLFESYHIHCGRNPMETTIDSDDNSSSESSDDDISDENEDDFDVDDEEDDDSKLEIVFTNDVPETTRNLKKNNKKKVSFNVDVEVKEFEPRPEEHFIRRKEETETPEVMVTQIDDIVEKVTNTSLENNTDPVDDEDNARPVSRFKANRKKINTNK